MSVITAVIAGSFTVGVSIGWCGIAGFLLPILFMGNCGLRSDTALFISFLCFAVSGVVGAKNYKKRGELPTRESVTLGLSSLLGSCAGALIGQVFVSSHIKTVLYFVVLFSGCAILFQEILLRSVEKKEAESVGGDTLQWKNISLKVLVMTGLLTSLLCALSGAGGPVLVMPILVLLGMPVKFAIGTALLDSVFIAIPAVFVYGSKADPASVKVILAAALLSHAAGIELGSRTARAIPQKPLKRSIAVGSIAFAVFMLLR